MTTKSALIKAYLFFQILKDLIYGFFQVKVEAYLRHGGGLIGYDPNPLLPPHIQTQIQAGKKTQNPWKISFKMNVQSQGLFDAHLFLK